MNSNPTHCFYQTLVEAEANQEMLAALERTVKRYSAKKGQERLSMILQSNSLLPDKPIDYPRLWALLRKDLAGQNLCGEDFSGMTLDHFTFVGASLDEANFREARLFNADFSDGHMDRACFDEAWCSTMKVNRASLSGVSLISANWSWADCRNAVMDAITATKANFESARFDHANLSHGNLREANLRCASLAFCDLVCVSFEGANLYRCRCSTASFGQTLQFDSQTTISPDNHTLISMVLLTHARSVEQHQFALYIRYQTDMCWSGFTRLLLRQRRELVSWVEETLGTVSGLQTHVETYAKEYSYLLSQEGSCS